MPYVTQEQIEQARQMDLLTYLQNYNSEELVQISGDAFSTSSHDSLKISNGKWYQWSEGIGGRSALDYLVEIENVSFTEAVELLCDSPVSFSFQSAPIQKFPAFELPKKWENNKRVTAYLASRGIDFEIINHCIKHGKLYEGKTKHKEQEYHNAVFVGYDGEMPKYAYLRAAKSHSTFMREVTGSDKRFSFSLLPKGNAPMLFVFEGAIDLLSMATLHKMSGKDWRSRSYLSLGGVASPKKYNKPSISLALDQYLRTHQAPLGITLCFDNDRAGREAAGNISLALPQFSVHYKPPEQGKDCNELLQIKKGITDQMKMRGNKFTPKSRDML